jgi:hypothetical protein
MLKFFIDSIFVELRGLFYAEIIGISMGTNGALFLTDHFLYSYVEEFTNK